MSTPSIKVGQGNWGIKAGNLLAYANTEKKFVAREFTVGRLLDTATRVNPSGNIEIVNANIPRIDYFGGQASLLVEPSAANGILNSTDTTTNWTLGPNLSRAAIDVIGVSGTNLTVNAAGNLGSAGRISRASNNVALAGGSTYTISFFIKKTGTHTIGGYYANMTGAAGGDLAAGFDVSGSFNSGLIYGSAGTTNRIRRVEQWGTDVFRCSETFTMTQSGTLVGMYLAPIVSVTSPTNSANGTQLGFAAPQVELGSVPTSFIPTTTGSVTRNADVISLTGVAGLIGQTEGTIYAEFSLSHLVGDRTIFEIGAGNSHRIRLRINGSTISASAIVFGSSVGSISFSSQPTGVYKLAYSYAQNDFRAYLNGNPGTPVTSGNVPVNMGIIGLGTRVGSLPAGVDLFNDRIRSAALYTTRLTNAELAALTKL